MAEGSLEKLLESYFIPAGTWSVIPPLSITGFTVNLFEPH